MVVMEQPANKVPPAAMGKTARQAFPGRDGRDGQPGPSGGPGKPGAKGFVALLQTSQCPKFKKALKTYPWLRKGEGVMLWGTIQNHRNTLFLV